MVLQMKNDMHIAYAIAKILHEEENYGTNPDLRLGVHMQQACLKVAEDSWSLLGVYDIASLKFG